MNTILMILLISVLILVHEFGHFLAARMCGIKVTKFGFGLPFGPTLYEKKIGDTTFYIHAFLLGGYVSFPDDDEDSDLPEDSPELFKNKTVGQRAFVAIAGVSANVICAIFLVLFTAFAWGKLPANEYEVYVTKIVEDMDKSLYTSGLQAGDKLVSVNGQKIKSPLQINFFAQASKEYDGVVLKSFVEENYEKLQKLNPQIALDSVIPDNMTIKLLQEIEEPAVSLTRGEMYGIKSKKLNNLKFVLTKEQKALRDELIGKKTYKSNQKYTLKDVAIATSDSRVPLFLEVERNGQKIALNKIYTNPQGVIGIIKENKELFNNTKDVKSVVENSFSYLYRNTETMIWSLGQLFTGDIPLKEMHGIVAITKVGGDVIQEQGLFKGFLLTAMISLNLAIVNLLPIPALDGGHLMFLFIEKLRGRAIDEKTVEKIASIGFYLLIVLMIFIVFNDIVGLINNKF